MPVFMDQLWTKDPHQRFWGPLATLFSMEKQAAVVFVCSLCAETGGKLWHPPAQATVSFLPSLQLLDHAGFVRVSTLTRQLLVFCTDQCFPSLEGSWGLEFCLLTLYWAERGPSTSISPGHCLSAKRAKETKRTKEQKHPNFPSKFLLNLDCFTTLKIQR